MKATYEYTDLFCGEPNYCWALRGDVEAATERGIIRAAKAATGLTGIPCRKADYGDMLEYRPYGKNTVLFITFTE